MVVVGPSNGQTDNERTFSSTAACVASVGLGTAMPSPTRSSSRSTKRAMASKRAASACVGGKGVMVASSPGRIRTKEGKGSAPLYIMVCDWAGGVSCEREGLGWLCDGLVCGGWLMGGVTT